MASEIEIKSAKEKAIAGGFDPVKAEQVFKMDHHRTNTGQVKNPEVFKMQIQSQNKY